MIYNGQKIGENSILLYEEVPNDNYILAVLYIPCNNNSTDIEGNKQAILEIENCNDYTGVSFEGVTEIDEDLLNGLIYFPNCGTWTANIYYQDNNTNVDPLLATFLTNIEIQIV